MDIYSELHKNMISLYEAPIPFWEKILGTDLHFHLGHFIHSGGSLEGAMRQAIRSLRSMIPKRPIERVLDIGCGWGGAAFEMAKAWNAEVLGLTISKQQSAFVNARARGYQQPVTAKTVDAECFAFEGIGAFDLLWLYEVLEHIKDRKSVFERLRCASYKDSVIAIAMTCRSPQVKREDLYNEVLGIQPLETIEELVALLSQTGWEVSTVRDCSEWTLPVWEQWINNTKQIAEPFYGELSEKLVTAFASTGELYRRGLLQSVQIVAMYCP